MAQSSAKCRYCAHDNTRHLLVPLISHPVVAGLILCNEACECLMTWSARHDHRYSTPDEVFRVRLAPSTGFAG